MKCAICLYAPARSNGEPWNAITIIGGLAVCSVHIGYCETPNPMAQAMRDKYEGKFPPDWQKPDRDAHTGMP